MTEYHWVRFKGARRTDRATTTVRAAAGRRVDRLPSGLPWLDAVLGGGFAVGSVVMVHGEPGAGKSTMLAQAAAGVQGSLYASAEEDEGRVADRAVRLGLRRDLTLLSADDAGAALAAADRSPLVVLDSVQRMTIAGVGGSVGSPRQVAAVAEAAVRHARSTGACVVLVCHETKGGRSAGPRVLEHVVDVSIRLGRNPRELSAEKNRYGSADVRVGLEMTARGLVGPGARRTLSWRLPGPPRWLLPLSLAAAVLAIMYGG